MSDALHHAMADTNNERAPKLTGKTGVRDILERRWRAAERTKAFEEAAEIRPPQPRLSEPENMHDYLEGWVDAVAAYTAAIRALAKEKPNE